MILTVSYWIPETQFAAQIVRSFLRIEFGRFGQVFVTISRKTGIFNINLILFIYDPKMINTEIPKYLIKHPNP